MYLVVEQKSAWLDTLVLVTIHCLEYSAWSVSGHYTVTILLGATIQSYACHVTFLSQLGHSICGERYTKALQSFIRNLDIPLEMSSL